VAEPVVLTVLVDRSVKARAALGLGRVGVDERVRAALDDDRVDALGARPGEDAAETLIVKPERLERPCGTGSIFSSV
jgi:hypothetical protein